MDEPPAVMEIDRLLKGRVETVGEFEAGSVAGRIIEPPRELPLANPIATYPASLEFDRTYQGGPTFVLRVSDGYADPSNGFAFTQQRHFIRESAVVGKYADKAAEVFASYDFAAAQSVRAGDIALVSNQRSGNYCRWWLDTVAKIFLFETYAPPGSRDRGITTWVTPNGEALFQNPTLSLIGYPPGPSFPRFRLMRGDFLMSSGLTFGGGQNISPLVRQFRAFVLEKAGLADAPRRRRRIFITRQAARMRRIVNEPELHAGLKDRGFEILTLEHMSLRDQIAAFAAAEIVFAPHGAGLTNLLFTPSDALLVEIFPDCGVHSSAFRRIASNLDIRYAMYAGPALGVPRKNNMRDIDLSVDPAHLLSFVDDVMKARF